MCAQIAHDVPTVYDRKTGEIRGGGVPRLLAITVFTERSMTLKREGGTFSFSLRISEGYSGTAIVALAVPTRVRLTLTHAIWPTYKLGHLIGFRGGTERTSTRWISIQTDRSLQMTNMPFCLFSQGAPTRQKLSQSQNSLRLQHRGMPGGRRSCQGATPGSSAIGSVREPRPNGRPGRMACTLRPVPHL